MAVFKYVQTFWAQNLSAISQVARLLVLAGQDGPRLGVFDPATGRLDSIALTAAPTGTGASGIQSQLLAGLTHTTALDIAGETHRIDRVMLTSLDTDHASSSTYLDRSGFVGSLTALHRLQVGTQSYVYMAPQTGGQICGFRQDADGGLTRIAFYNDTDSLYLRGVSAMTSLQTSGGTYLVAASLDENGLTVLRVGAEGQLTPTASFGVAELLPINRPTQIAAVDLMGQHFIFLGSYGSSSLTLLRLDANGIIHFVSQVLDSLDTRFAGVAAMDVFSSDGMVLVAIAGNDDGVSLFQLLPHGRLLLRDTIVDATHSALQNVQQLRFVMVEGQLQLFALGAADQGLTRLDLDLDQLGGVSTQATAGDDVLIAEPGGTVLQGLGGDDLLIDGAGADTLYGGAGADVFALIADAQTDVIQDFDIATDRLDFSGMPGLNSAADIKIILTPTGARLMFLGEKLTLICVTGTPLDAADLAGILLFNRDQLLVSQPPVAETPVLTNTGNDTFFWSSSGPRTINGGAGWDIISFAAAPGSVAVDLGGHTVNSGAAAGFVLQAIEAVEGSYYTDRLVAAATGSALFGLAGNDWLTGAAGNDSLAGGSGDDTLTAGLGNDTLHGGAGSDRAVFTVNSGTVNVQASADGLVITSTQGVDFIAQDVEFVVFADRILSYAEAAALRNALSLTGTEAGNVLTGTAADEIIKGLGGGDWLTPGTGNDTVDGGSGTDMISFSDHIRGVSVNLATGQAVSGADIKSLIGLESVTGSIYSDVIEGNGAANRLRGLGDYDWFIGSGGGDVIEGGNGRDMMSYVNATAGVSVDLTQKKGLAGQALGDTYDSIERVTGSSFGDIFFGDPGENDFRGMAGNDLFHSSAGGRERYDGGAGTDTVNYATANAGVSASLRLGYGAGGFAARDLYTSIENLTGSAFRDSLSGDAGRNLLQGGGGDDFIFGDAGSDLLYGGAGSDVLDGGAGSDYVYFNGTRAQFTLTKTSATTASITGVGAATQEGHDSLTGVEYFVFNDQTVTIWQL